MINEIQIKQNQILSKSEEDETKRIFIEAILSLLTIGVISLDNKFKINLFNNSSLKVLGKKTIDLENKIFLEVFPDWKKLVNNFKNSKRIIENFQIELIIDDKTSSFPAIRSSNHIKVLPLNNASFIEL